MTRIGVWRQVQLLLAVSASLSAGSGATPCFTLRDRRNPCKNNSCANNAQCVPALNKQQFKCVCLQDCWNVGDSDDSGAVCGSDAVDYPSICHLRRASCHVALNVQMAFKGACDPCNGFVCPATKRCRIDERRMPYCDCQECLRSSGQRVCGSDGKTYADDCQLRYSSCRQGLGLQKLYDGECRSGVHCNSPCLHRYMRCRVDPRTLESKCRCPTNCPKIIAPVCGTDDNDYPSVCELRRSACLRGVEVFPLIRGDCGRKAMCKLDENKCLNGSLCRMRIQAKSHHSFELVRHCDRPECVQDAYTDRQDLRVCGSDGVTYASPCRLRQASFDKEREISVRHKGSCNSCTSTSCPFYGLCRLAADGSATCHCPTHCVYVHEPVCASDGRTYELECEMRLTACRERKHITVLHKGPCKSTPTPAPTAASGRNGASGAVLGDSDLLEDIGWDDN